MLFKSIVSIFKTSVLKTPLGRWNIHNYEETMLKVKYATEDNCGVSYNYQNSKYNDKTKYNVKDKYNDKYIYMMAYESVHD